MGGEALEIGDARETDGLHGGHEAAGELGGGEGVAAGTVRIAVLHAERVAERAERV